MSETHKPQTGLPLCVEIGQVEIQRFHGSESAQMNAPGSILLEIALARLWVNNPSSRAAIIRIDTILSERYKQRGQAIFS